MVVGIVDHGTGTRDVRRLPHLGDGWRSTKVAAVVAAASMAGIPLTFGFVAKELGLEAFLDGGMAGDGVVLNARVDAVVRGGTVDEAIVRGRAYLAAGADCVYPIFMADRDDIARFVEAVGGPVNILFRPGAPSVAELSSLGVARVSVGSGWYRAVQSAMTDALQASRHAETQMAAQVQGKAELIDVATAISTAETSLETVMAVRDQVISAYQEIMRMPI